MIRMITVVSILIPMIFFISDTFSKEKRTVVVWHFSPCCNQFFERGKDIEERFGINLDVQVVAQAGFVRKLQACMIDGKGVPDIIEWMIENNRILYDDPDKSFLIPLDRFVAKSRTKDIVPEGRFDWVRYGKHIYGLPHDAHPCLLVYNDTIWKSVDVDMAKIETWDEFFEAAKKLAAVTEKGKQKYFALPYGSAGEFNKKKEDTSEDGLNNTMFMIWQQSGSQILDTKGNPRFTSPEFRAFLEKWLEWRKSGAFTSWDWGNFAALLANGTLASYVSPDWWIPQVNLASTGSIDFPISSLGEKRVKRAEVKYQFRVRSLPVYRKGGLIGSSWGGSFLGIPKGTKDPELIYRIAEYLQYNNNALLIRWESTGMLPPNKDIWYDPMFHKPDARFGGQKLGELMIASAWGLPRINTGAVFWDAINIFSEEYKEIISGKKTIDEALASAQKRTLDKMKGE